jgi:hypothetical protein
MDIIIVPFLRVFLAILDLYKVFYFLYIILGWLEHFNVINKYNPFATIHNFLFSITSQFYVLLNIYPLLVLLIFLLSSLLWHLLSREIIIRILIRFILMYYYGSFLIYALKLKIPKQTCFYRNPKILSETLNRGNFTHP